MVLLRGAKDSATLNNTITGANLLNLVLVVAAGMASHSIDVENLTPFAPNGLPGILQGAGYVEFKENLRSSSCSI